MRIVKSCVLELREYKGRRIICQLNLDCSVNDGIDFEEPKDFHWLEKEHWQTFDAQLVQIIDSISDKAPADRRFEDKSYQLNEEVNVLVRKSSSAVKTLLELLGHITLERKDNILALEFSIQRSTGKKDITPKRDAYSPTYSIAENLEYLPQPISSINTSADSSYLLYVPSNSEKCDLGSDDPDRYTPPKLPLSPNVSLVYKPRPIQKTNDLVNKEESIFTCSSEDGRDADGDKDFTQLKKNKSTSAELQEENIYLKKEEKKERKHRRYHIKHNDNKQEYANTSSENTTAQERHSDIQLSDSPVEILNLSAPHDDNIDLMKYLNPKGEKSIEHKEKKITKESETNSKSKSKHKHESAYSKTKEKDPPNKELRRSNRSPVKPLRYEESYSERYKKTTANKKRSNELMRKYFGSDAESDDFVEKTPVKPAPKTQFGSAHVSSSVKKRKREEKSERECQQEKQSMSKWLSKKKPEELVKSPKKSSKPTKSRSKEAKVSGTKTSSTIVKRIVYPTPEEIAENERREKAQMRVNENMKNILKDLIQVPKKVEILSLNDMTAEEILNTFTKYKHKLDDIFHKLRSKSKVTGYNGINHYSVIELIDNEIQLKMMHKLGEVYEKDIDGTSLYSTLFANALMPEWLVHIFKDKYNFSYNEAVTRLEEQMQYMQYMDVEEHQP